MFMLNRIHDIIISMFVIGLQLREWCIYGVGGPIGLWFGWKILGVVNCLLGNGI